MVNSLPPSTGATSVAASAAAGAVRPAVGVASTAKLRSYPRIEGGEAGLGRPDEGRAWAE